MLKFRLLLPLLAAYPLAMPTASAAPDDVCVRQAQAVPGAAVKHPQWWLPGLNNAQHEVRWTGATRHSTGDGATPELAASRVIWDKASSTAFFEFTVNNDPSIDGLEDVLMLSVANAAGDAPEMFMLFQPLRGCSTLSNCTGQGSAVAGSAINYSQATTGTSTTWSALSTTNTNTNFTVDHPWVEVQEVVSGGSTVYNWTLRFALQVPTSRTGEIRSNLRTYANAVMYMPGPTSATALELPVLCNPSSPTSNDCMVFSGSAGDVLPESLPTGNMATTWPVIRSTDPGSCEGIELIRPLVGSDHGTTTGVVPGTSVPYELPGFAIPRTTGAHFRAGFHNNTSQVVGSGTVSAEFRIANWGLQYANWDQATWDLVGTAVLAGDVSAGGYAGGFSQGMLESGLWIPANAELALENDHQCVHVQLTSSTPGVDFTVDSVYRNMDIINASVARRPADIDLGNRPLPKGHKKHKVYLLVRSEHMPGPGVCSKNKKAYGCAKGGKLVLERKALTGKQKKALSNDLKAGRIKMSKADLNTLLKQKKRKGKKVDELPYYAVYGMVDTGRRINLPDAPQTPVLMNFSSYGYAVQHEGLPAMGWENYMHGAQPAGKNLYKLEVKPKTVASVANTVRVLSKETKACKVKPKPNWAVYGLKKTEVLEAKIKADVGKGKASKVAAVRVTDEQLGCDPPPLRLPCKAKDCREHSPIDYIEGSRYVGDWAAIDRRGKKRAGRRAFGKRTGLKPSAKKPSAKKPSAKKPSAKKPSAKKPSAKKPSGKLPTKPGIGKLPTK